MAGAPPPQRPGGSGVEGQLTGAAVIPRPVARFAIRIR